MRSPMVPFTEDFDQGQRYGCADWKDCDTRRSAPAYKPKQPEKCRRHRAWMTTEIPEEQP